MVTSLTEFGSENDCAGESQQQIETTDPSSRQREGPIQTHPQLSDSNKDLVVRPIWVHYSKTDWPSDRRLDYHFDFDFDFDFDQKTGEDPAD
jgi:hypothetical protein